MTLIKTSEVEIILEDIEREVNDYWFDEEMNFNDVGLDVWKDIQDRKEQWQKQLEELQLEKNRRTLERWLTK